MPCRLAQVAVRVVVMVVAVMMEWLMRLWGDRGWAVGVLAVVMVMLVVWVIVSAGVSGQLVGVVLHAPRIWVMMLLAVAMMAVVVRAPVALKSALLLQLLLDVRRRRVAVSRGSNQGLHCVVRGQT